MDLCYLIDSETSKFDKILLKVDIFLHILFEVYLFVLIIMFFARNIIGNILLQYNFALLPLYLCISFKFIVRFNIKTTCVINVILGFIILHSVVIQHEIILVINIVIFLVFAICLFRILRYIKINKKLITKISDGSIERICEFFVYIDILLIFGVLIVAILLTKNYMHPKDEELDLPIHENIAVIEHMEEEPDNAGVHDVNNANNAGVHDVNNENMNSLSSNCFAPIVWKCKNLSFGHICSIECYYEYIKTPNKEILNLYDVD